MKSKRIKIWVACLALVLFGVASLGARGGGWSLWRYKQVCTIYDDADIVGDNITAGQAIRGVVITNDGKGGSVDWNLPSLQEGLQVYVFAEEAQLITLDSASGDIIVLIDGTALDAGDAIDSDSAAGSSIKLVGHDTTYWYVHSQVGVWTDGGAD